MKLTIKRYGVILSFQTILLLVDFSINVFSMLMRQHNGLSLILFVLQTACLILSLGTLFVTFFSTYAFQAGLINLLYEKFHVSLIVFFLYFVLSIVVQIWSVVVHWDKSNSNINRVNWSTAFFVLFILQRTLTPFYYYYYKRASLRLSDPRFYEDVWNNENLGLNNN